MSFIVKLYLGGLFMKKVLIVLLILLIIEIIAIGCYYFFYAAMLPAQIDSVVNDVSNIQNSEN